MNSDIIFCIFEYLNSVDLLNCSLINKQFCAISTSELLWKRICDQKYETQVTNNYYATYKSWTRLQKFLDFYNRSSPDKRNRDINMHCRHLKSLPDEFVLLKNLSRIDLSNNDLSIIPPQLFSLINLSAIFLDYNCIEIIPESIGTLTNLQILYIPHNKLQSLNESICTLTGLRGLSIEHNDLQSIPNSMSLLTNLCDLYVDHIQQRLIPKSFVGKLRIMT
jgi:hypothetical protein